MVGLLLDSLSQNTGDQAILEVMVGFLQKEQRPFGVLSPLGFETHSEQTIIIGGGHLLRDPGDWFYDAFRVPGRHVLNVAGTSTTIDLDYLRQYRYVSVRAQADFERMQGAVPGTKVRPCVSLKLQPETGNLLAPAQSIGFHFHEQSWADCGSDRLFHRFREYPQCLIPVTHYNGDYQLLERIVRNLSRNREEDRRPILLPRLPPRAILREISGMRALVCSSLHASIFAYSRNIPFLAYGDSEKIAAFMEDRGLEKWLYRNRAELESKLIALLDSPVDYSSSLRKDLSLLDEHFRALSDALPAGAVPRSARAPETEGKLVEHRLLVEHQNRLDLLERLGDRLREQGEREERHLSRQDLRVDELRKILEQRSRSAAGGEAGALSSLPFGSVESPAAGAQVFEECRLSGWALAGAGIVEVAVYLDGQFAASASYGDARPDVARAYPGFSDSTHPGWNLDLDLTAISVGAHEILVQARSRMQLTHDLGTIPIVVGAPEVPEKPPSGAPVSRATLLAESVDSLAKRLDAFEAQQTGTMLHAIGGQIESLGGEIHRVSASSETQAQITNASISNLANAVAAMAAKIDKMADSVSTGSANIDQLAVGLSNSGEAIDSLKANATASSTRMEVLTERLASGENRIFALSAELAAGASSYNARLDALMAELSARDAKIESLTRGLSTVTNAASVLARQWGRGRAKAARSAVEVRDRIDPLAAQIAASNHEIEHNRQLVHLLYGGRIWRTLRALSSPLRWLTDRAGSKVDPQPQPEAAPASFSDASQNADIDRELLYGDAPAALGRDMEALAGDLHGLKIGIDSPLPDTVSIGKGTAIPLWGWCYHPRRAIMNLEIAAGKIRRPAKLHTTFRPDVLSAHFPQTDPHGRSLTSGFWGLAIFPGDSADGPLDLFLLVTFEGGDQVSARVAGVTLIAEASKSIDHPSHGESPRDPLVVVCLATYNPPLQLFARQIESLQNQTHPNWECIIRDDCSSQESYDSICRMVRQDPRFSVHRGTERLGFYRNFEQALYLVPPDAGFVTFCDQDDYWHADKIEALLAEFDGDSKEERLLVYSDMNIVDEQGQLLSNTYWTTRKNHFKDLASLLIANTVTGAASMFRHRLLDLALPFPGISGGLYHDHWLACMALAAGKVAYIDRPLYDYVQHGRNVIGHHAPQQPSWLWLQWRGIRSSETFERTLNGWRDIYFGDVLRIELLAVVLELRTQNTTRSGRRKSKALERLSQLDRSISAGLWLPLRMARRLWRGNETLAAENRLFAGLLWKHYVSMQARKGLVLPLPEPRTSSPVSAFAPLLSSEERQGHPAAVRLISQKIAPLTLEISDDEEPRVNLLIPTVDFNYVFGGYIAKFNLARKLSEQGIRVRLVIVDHCDFQPTRWKEQFLHLDGVGSLLQTCDWAYAFDRSEPLRVTVRDTFIATTWWTAYIARDASRQLENGEFVYLIQEFEPFTFAMGTFASLARDTYNWPHYAIFSTDFLREYFRRERIGVFANGDAEGIVRSTAFNNAITKVTPVTATELRRRTSRKLLFYARPEDHAARNMFELGTLALCRAIEAGVFNESLSGETWTFDGIGSVGEAVTLELAAGRQLRLLRRQNQNDYARTLREYDLGLSLMYTPHPSLVPLEMASAGMVVVTNTFENKTAASLRAISGNLIGVEPSLDGIVDGLKMAVCSVEQFHRREAQAVVSWPSDWDEALDQPLMDRVTSFLSDLQPLAKES